MAKPFVSIPKATSISTGIFLLGLAVIAYYDEWWPFIMLPIGISLALRQVLLKKFYDALISLIVFVGIFVTFYYNLSWLPVLFVIAGLYVLFCALQTEPETVVDEDEEIQKVIEEDSDKNKTN